MSTQSTFATTFRSLHTPGKPLILTNVYDASSALTIAQLSNTPALATASYAIASGAGYADDDLPLEANPAAIRAIAPIAKKHNLPLTVDFQDGYGDHLEEGVSELLKLGVVGINLEDCTKETHEMMHINVAIARTRLVLDTAKAAGMHNFVVNARCDALMRGATIQDTIKRGKAYLQAGATTIFVIGGAARGGLSRNEVVELVEAFEGRLNVVVKLGGEGLSVKELAGLGVARISVGPQLQKFAMKAFGDEAQRLLGGR